MYFPPLIFKRFQGLFVHIHDITLSGREDSGLNSTDIDIAWEAVKELIAAGVQSLDVGSLLQVARNSEDDWSRVETMLCAERRPGVRYAAYVSACDEAQRAMAVGINEVCTAISVSERHNVAMFGKSIGQTEEFLEHLLDTAYGNATVQVLLHSAFGCPLGGGTCEEAVIDIGDWLWSRGVSRLTLCDSSGLACPAQVERLCDGLVERWPGSKLTLFFRKNRGMELVNLVAGLSAGIRDYVGIALPTRMSAEIVPLHCMDGLASMLSKLGCVTGVECRKLPEA